MLFWVVCAFLTISTIIWIVRPLAFFRDDAASRGADADVYIYRDQLQEVQRDQERGLIAPAEAEAARLEISRRLLNRPADDDAAVAGGWTGSLSGAVPAIGAAAFVLIGSMVFYLGLGRPGLPGTVHAERAKQNPSTASVSEQIARVEARLREHPEDGAGWDVLAPVYLKLGRFSDAANAFRQSIKLNGESPRRLGGLAEAGLAITNGMVTAEVGQAYAKILTKFPGDPIARFWLAVAKEQAGDAKGAAAGYRALLREKSGSEKFHRLLQERIATVDQEMAGAANAGRLPAPDGEAAKGIASLPPGERRKAIEGMVEGLAQRLKSDGGDAGSWQRLVRAYAVLGEKTKAKAALELARKALKADTKALEGLEGMARDIGLN